MRFWLPKPFAQAIEPKGAIIGLTKGSNQPIYAPPGHSQLLSANGGGKTTRGLMPRLLSNLSTTSRGAILILDSKDGEVCQQVAPMLAKLGIAFSILDDLKVLPELAEHRVSLNSFGPAVTTAQYDPEDLIFVIEKITNALIEEPSDGDEKNKPFRDFPRDLIEFAMRFGLARKASHATPGAAALLLSDPDLLIIMAEHELVEGTPELQASARGVLAAAKSEHWGTFVKDAQRGVRLWMPGTRLHEAGAGATLSYADLIRQKQVVFLVGPQKHMSRMGPKYALDTLGFLDAMFNGAGQVDIFADEFTNCPLQALVADITTMRAFGGAVHMIAQSRSEIVRKFGENEARTLEENAIVKQWFGFSSFEEAERVSKAIGEEYAISKGMSGDTRGLDANTSLNPIKQAIISPARLMEMKPDEQLIHVKGVGFILANTISQENLDPYCHLLAENKLEGGRLNPDPKITLATPKVTS